MLERSVLRTIKFICNFRRTETGASRYPDNRHRNRDDVHEESPPSAADRVSAHHEVPSLCQNPKL